MTTATIYPSTSDTVRSSNSTFTTMLAGSSLVIHTSDAYLRVGQAYIAPTYYGYEAFVKFDLSSIPAGSTINSVTYRVVSQAVINHTVTMYIDSLADFGTIDTSDWHDRTQLQALTPMASCATGGGTPANTTLTFTESGTALRDWVAAAAGGNGFGIVWDDYLESGSAVTSTRLQFLYDEADGTPANRPALIIDYTAPASGIPAHLMRRQHYGPRGLTGQGGPFHG